MANEDSYKLIQQMAADSYEAEMMKDPDFRLQMAAAEAQERGKLHDYFSDPETVQLPTAEQVTAPTSWAQASEGLDPIPQRQHSEELER